MTDISRITYQHPVVFTLLQLIFSQETKSKLPEKANLGFPVSDGIGRLQVWRFVLLKFRINFGSDKLKVLLLCFTASQIIKNSDLEELRELGSGTFGTVYHGKWRGSDVAIKRINDRCFSGKPSEQERMVRIF